MDCIEAQHTILSPLASIDNRVAAKEHVLSCAICSSNPEDDEHQASLILRLQRRTDGQLLLRATLALLAVAHVSLSLPWLLGLNSWWAPTRDAAVQHLTRDGVIALVFAVAAGLSAASRRLAWFSLIPSLIAATLQLTAGIYDYNVDHTGAWFEAIHLLGVATSALIALENRPRRSYGN